MFKVKQSQRDNPQHQEAGTQLQCHLRALLLYLISFLRYCHVRAKTRPAYLTTLAYLLYYRLLNLSI